MLRPVGTAAGSRRQIVRPTDVAALRIWLLSRIAAWALVGAGAWLFATNEQLVPLLQRWVQWDFHHLRAIAAQGYAGQPTGEPLEAFFPGFPLLLRALRAIGVDYVVGGLLISFIAGGVAVVALARLAELERPVETGGTGGTVGERAVLMFMLAPSAIFLAAPYTEALFLGFAIPAWLAVRQGRWPLAAVLAAGACTVRVTGLFLAVALIVEYLTGGGRRQWADLSWLLMPFVPVLMFTAYLHSLTGDWLRWAHAQEEGWNRSFTDPVAAFRATWDAAFGGSQPLGFAWMFRAEIVAVLVGVVLTGWLIWRLRFGEATYVGLAVVAYATSTWYFSVPRAALLWWPLYIGLACWSMRRPIVLAAYLTLVAPFAVVFALLYSVGRWAG
jgi:Mannosyltransferase (PIG-V)